MNTESQQNRNQEQASEDQNAVTDEDLVLASSLLDDVDIVPPNIDEDGRIAGLGGSTTELYDVSHGELFRALNNVDIADPNNEEDNAQDDVAPRPTHNFQGLYPLTAQYVENIENSARTAAQNPSHTIERKEKDIQKQEKLVRSGKQQKLEEYFQVSTASAGINRENSEFKCTQCGQIVQAKARRHRLYHIILCPHIPFTVRWGFYFMSNDARKPPLLERPPVGCTTQMANLMVRLKSKSLQELLQSHLSRRDDLSRDLSLSRYILGKAGVKTNVNNDSCSDEEKRMKDLLLMDFLVEENVPFAVCRYRESFPRPLGRLLNYSRPGYKIPPLTYVKGQKLQEYFQVVQKEVKKVLRNAIYMQCRTSVMFDGSEDITGQPIVNVLVRLNGSARAATKTYFVKSFYTGYDTCTASYYVGLVNNVVV